MNKYSVIINDEYQFFIFASNIIEAKEKIDFIEPTLTKFTKDVRLVQKILGE